MSFRRMLLPFTVLVLVSIPALGVAGAADSFILVSDVDDTVKVTNVRSFDAGAKSAVASELVFAGMPELYRVLLGENSSAERLEFLSGSPSILSHKVSELLNDAYFPAHNMTLRGWRELFSSACNYKAKHMQVMYGASKDKLLLVGDDTESDPEVYAAFSSQKSTDQVLGIYIHRITGRALPLGSVMFVTAYDIAIKEYVAGRLTEEQVALVGNAVLNSQERTFLPGFQECPKEYIQIPGLPKSLEELKEAIERRMIALCANRRPTLALHRTANALCAPAAR